MHKREPFWTPWKQSVREDGAGELYEWVTCLVICGMIQEHDHGKEVYCPVSFLADSIPPKLSQKKLMEHEHILIIGEMRRYGCSHTIPPIPPVTVDA